MFVTDQLELEAKIELDYCKTWRAGVGQIDPLLSCAAAEKQQVVDVPTQPASNSIAKKGTGFCRLAYSADIAVPRIIVTADDGRAGRNIGVDIGPPDIRLDVRC